MGDVEKPTANAQSGLGEAVNLLANVKIASILSGVKIITPAQTEWGWGWIRYVKETATPKFWPAPRMAQKRSGWEMGDTLMMLPSARTNVAESILSMTRPWRGVNQPQPPPRDNPPMPV